MSTVRVVFVWILALKLTGAFPQFGFENNRPRRDGVCRDGIEYPQNNICCLNCPASTYVKSHCTRAGERGVCEKCGFETYTEHANGLNQCFKCTPCRLDQEIVKPCITTQDTVCQCKPGRFCSPDEACEICKKCSKCGKDEEIVRNCTPTTNTECKKLLSGSKSALAGPGLIVGCVLFSAGLIVTILALFFCWRRRRRATESQRNPPDGIKDRQHDFAACPTEERQSGETQRSSISNCHVVRAKSSAIAGDECQVLFESLDSSASNSQHSLTSLPSSAIHATFPLTRPVAPQHPNKRKDEEFPELVPVNGVESLKKCFEYFEKIEFDYHKRFFRHIGIDDNLISVTYKDHAPYEDKLHDLLNHWVEKRGKEANVNDLLKALLHLNQRRTAETIMERAVEDGHYVVCESRGESNLF